MKIKYFFTVLFSLFFVKHSHTQINEKGLPFITNYSDEVYQAFPQNWQAVQDKRGVMFFANQTSILEYDGRSWRQINISDHVFTRSLSIDNEGTLYFGTSRNFGYLSPDKKGKLLPVILSDSIEEQDLVKNDFWKIISTDNYIYFFNIHTLFRYDKKDAEIDFWPLSDYDIFQVFLVHNKLFLSCFDNGLICFDDGNFELFENSDFFFDIGIVSLIELSPDEMLAVTYDSGLFLIKIGKDSKLSIKVFNENLQLQTQNVFFYAALKINTNEIAIATLGNGIYIIDEAGHLLNIINEDNGLISNNISSIYIGRSGSDKSVLWAVTDKGLSKIDWYSPFRLYGQKSGLSGAITDAVRFNNKLYLASTNGLYYYTIDSQTQKPVFKTIKGINNEVWKLVVLKYDGKEHLIACTSYNLFKITGTSAAQITTNYNTHSLYQLKSNPSTAYISLGRGLAKLKITSDGFIDSGPLYNTGVSDRAIVISEDDTGHLWLQSDKDGAIYYDTERDTIIHIFNHAVDSLIPVINTIFKVEQAFFLGTPQGVYKYDEAQKSFYPTKLFREEGKDPIDLLRAYVDGNNAWAVFMEGGVIKVGKLDFKNNRLLSTPFNRIKNPNIWGFYKDKEIERLMILSSDLVYLYDTSFDKNYSAPFNALIREVTVNNEHTIFHGSHYAYNNLLPHKVFSDVQHPDAIVSLPYASNNISFAFAAPFYELGSYTRYSFFLEGNDDGWSEWSERTEREYTNLFEGKYTFHVKAKNIYGTESRIDSYSFIVLPPWYRTHWAYLSYLIFLALIIWGIVKLSIYRLQKINEAYGKYLPGSFLKVLDKRRIIDFRLGDMTEKEMTIMFSDIRAYTKLSESMTPHDNFRFLVSYLKKIGGVLNKNKGFPVQYYGDGVMAMFHGKTDNVLQAAIDMHKAVEVYSKERQEKGRRAISIGIGLHTGNVIMGIRGDESRWEGGIVGDAVNIASRIEGLTKILDAATILTENVFEHLNNPGHFNFRLLGKVKVKGKEMPLKIYELIDGSKKEIFDIKISISTDFKKAVQLYIDGRLDEALNIFTNITQKHSDVASLFYIKMIKKIEVAPENFDGSLIMETK